LCRYAGEHDLAGLLSATQKTAAGGFRLGQIKHLMMQLFSALEHCHARGVMHRDVKAGGCTLYKFNFSLPIHSLKVGQTGAIAPSLDTSCTNRTANISTLAHMK
jgi:serine/threonine protein kinase